MKNSSLQTITFGEVQLKKKKKKKTSNFESIKSSETANQVIRKILPVEQINYREYMYALYLNNSNDVIGYHQISIGGITGTIVDVRILLQGILLCNGSGIIIIHNHPSGNLKPSIQDKRITEKVKTACETLDIKLLDHLIITEENYYSFADNGEL